MRNDAINGLTSTATAAGSTTLTVNSLPVQRFTGSTIQTIVLPVVTTLSAGWKTEIINDSTGALTVNSSGGNLVATVAAGDRTSLSCTAISADTTAAPWAVIKFIQSTSAVSGVPAGTIIAFSGSSVPTGYLQCATTVTNVSRTTYADLFTAIGTAWGVGDGSTTFGIPYFATGFVPVQETAGVLTNGAVISHIHSVPAGGSIGVTAGTIPPGASTTPSGGAWSIGSTGGTNNLAAGMGVKFCVKF